MYIDFLNFQIFFCWSLYNLIYFKLNFFDLFEIVIRGQYKYICDVLIFLNQIGSGDWVNVVCRDSGSVLKKGSCDSSYF